MLINVASSLQSNGMSSDKHGLKRKNGTPIMLHHAAARSTARPSDCVAWTFAQQNPHQLSLYDWDYELPFHDLRFLQQCSLQCFDAAGWVVRKSSARKNTGWCYAGSDLCGAKWYAHVSEFQLHCHLHHLPATVKLRMVCYSVTSLSRYSWYTCH